MRKELIIVKNNYNELADSYFDLRKKGELFYNEYLEMPTTLRVLGNVRGKKILDLGCGPGIYAKILSKKGAKVKGIDISDKEIEIARRENPSLEFNAGNIENLPYNDSEFDIVLASLVMEHLKNWDIVLKEIRRVLKKGGFFVFSASTPASSCLKKRRGRDFSESYFKESKIKSLWWNRVNMFYYHKTYTTIIKTLIIHNFELADYEDARPVLKAKKLFPREYLLTSKIPYFSTWKWSKK